MEMTYKHLKPEPYYSDLYDRFTIEECRRVEKFAELEYKPKSKPKKIKVTYKESSLSKEEKKRLLWKVFDLLLTQKNDASKK